jgi:N-acetylglucosamine kinase-like BadF-type ATPase
MSIYVGVDGGGTRTRCVAVDGKANELARAESGAGLVDPAVPAAGVPALATLIRSVLRAAGAAPPVEVLCCALAGAGREADRQRVAAALDAERLARRVLVVTDAEAAMYACFGQGPGVLLIAGTGSIAWARSADGRLLRAGGWGGRIGDEGSAYALGIAALRSVMRAHDGRGATTALTARVLAAADVDAPESLVSWAARAPKGSVAALATLVVELAGRDAVAAAIVDECVADLVNHVRAIRERMSPTANGYELVLAGGMLAADGPLRPRLAAALAQFGDLRLQDHGAVDAAHAAALMAREATD